jgi:protein SCO1/2
MLLLCAAAPLRAGFADGTGPGVSEPIFVPDADKKVNVKEHPGASLPLDAWFTDETGKNVQLRQYFDAKRKPVILQIGYYRCPMLCGLISRGLVDSLKQVRLNAGPDYEVVFISIDPRETPELAAKKKESFLKAYARDGSADGWHLLTGNKLQIDRVTEAAGVEYRWVGQAQQYSHPAVSVLATPDGKISRYLYGVKFDSQTMRLSLVEASDGKIGDTVDAFILTCYQFDGKQGKYALAAISMMKIGGLFTILILGTVLYRLLRRERHDEPATET